MTAVWIIIIIIISFLVFRNYSDQKKSQNAHSRNPKGKKSEENPKDSETNNVRKEPQHTITFAEAGKDGKIEMWDPSRLSLQYSLSRNTSTITAIVRRKQNNRYDARVYCKEHPGGNYRLVESTEIPERFVKDFRENDFIKWLRGEAFSEIEPEIEAEVSQEAVADFFRRTGYSKLTGDEIYYLQDKAQVLDNAERELIVKRRYGHDRLMNFGASSSTYAFRQRASQWYFEIETLTKNTDRVFVEDHKAYRLPADFFCDSALWYISRKLYESVHFSEPGIDAFSFIEAEDADEIEKLITGSPQPEDDSGWREIKGLLPGRKVSTNDGESSHINYSLKYIYSVDGERYYLYADETPRFCGYGVDGPGSFTIYPTDQEHYYLNAFTSMHALAECDSFSMLDTVMNEAFLKLYRSKKHTSDPPKDHKMEKER